MNYRPKYGDGPIRPKYPDGWLYPSMPRPRGKTG